MKLKYIFVIITFLISFDLIAKIIYVSPKSNGLQTGQSWQDAFVSLHMALNSANYKDSIFLSEGTYLPSDVSNRNTSFFLKKGIKLYGGFLGTENSFFERNLDQYKTIIDGNIGLPNAIYDNSYHLLTIENPDSETIIDGLIFKNSYSSTDTIEWYNSENTLNASIQIISESTIYDQSIKVLNCTFEDNHSLNSGSILELNQTHLKSIFFLNCNLKNNKPIRTYFPFINIFGNNELGLISFDNCIFYNNGLLKVTLTESCKLSIVNCIITNDKFEANIYTRTIVAFTNNKFENTQSNIALTTQQSYISMNIYDGLDDSILINNCNFISAGLQIENFTNTNSNIFLQLSKSFFDSSVISIRSTSNKILNCIFKNYVNFIYGQSVILNCDFIQRRSSNLQGFAHFYEKTNIVNCIFSEPDKTFPLLFKSKDHDTIYFSHCLFDNFSRDQIGEYDIASGGLEPMWNSTIIIDKSNIFERKVRFTNYSKNDFNLIECSPGINSGATEINYTSLFTEDYLNKKRIVGKAIDIGCYENQMPFSLIDSTIYNINCKDSIYGSASFNFSNVSNYYWKTENDLGSTFDSLNKGIYTLIFYNPNCVDSFQFNIVQAQSVNLLPKVSYSCNNMSVQSELNFINHDSSKYTFYAEFDSIFIPPLKVKSGIFNFKITDLKGCFQKGFITIPNFSKLNIHITSQNPSSQGSNGKITIDSISGSILPYMIKWANGSIDQIQNNLSPGSYNVKVSDSIGCYIDTIIKLIDNSNILNLITLFPTYSIRNSRTLLNINSESDAEIDFSIIDFIGRLIWKRKLIILKGQTNIVEYFPNLYGNYLAVVEKKGYYPQIWKFVRW